MSLSFALFTYLVTWCITLFLIIPFRLPPKRAVLWNTLLAAAVTLAIYLLLKSGLVPLRDYTSLRGGVADAAIQSFN